jgi:ribonuclease D
MTNNRYQENITTEEIAERELSWFKGEIAVVEDMAVFNNVFPRLLGEQLLGFDTETKPSFKKGKRNKVALIQLSTGTLACLFRINKLGLPEELLKLLSDPGVTKAGVAIHDDLRFLSSLKEFKAGGFIDLQNFVKDYGIQSSGLKKLAAIILDIRISKRQQVTDWEASELTEAQKIYAATDAWVCHQIYRKLTNGQDG